MSSDIRLTKLKASIGEKLQGKLAASAFELKKKGAEDVELNPTDTVGMAGLENDNVVLIVMKTGACASADSRAVLTPYVCRVAGRASALPRSGWRRCRASSTCKGCRRPLAGRVPRRAGAWLGQRARARPDVAYSTSSRTPRSPRRRQVRARCDWRAAMEPCGTRARSPCMFSESRALLVCRACMHVGLSRACAHAHPRGANGCDAHDEARALPRLVARVPPRAFPRQPPVVRAPSR